MQDPRIRYTFRYKTEQEIEDEEDAAMNAADDAYEESRDDWED